MKDKYSNIRSLLRRALDGELSLDDAGLFMSGISARDDELVQQAAHIVIHYLDDEDLREKDPEYDKLMRAELLSYVKQLESR